MWVTIASGASLVIMLLITAVVLVKVPSDHFSKPRSSRARSRAWRVGKNALGLLLAGLGVVLLVLPGQGLLTIVLGVSLLDVPGKRRLLRRLIGHPRVLRPINALRARFGREPLRPPPRGPSPQPA